MAITCSGTPYSHVRVLIAYLVSHRQWKPPKSRLRVGLRAQHAPQLEHGRCCLGCSVKPVRRLAPAAGCCAGGCWLVRTRGEAATDGVSRPAALDERDSPCQAAGSAQLGWAGRYGCAREHRGTRQLPPVTSIQYTGSALSYCTHCQVVCCRLCYSSALACLSALINLFWWPSYSVYLPYGQPLSDGVYQVGLPADSLQSARKVACTFKRNC